MVGWVRASKCGPFTNLARTSNKGILPDRRFGCKSVKSKKLVHAGQCNKKKESTRLSQIQGGNMHTESVTVSSTPLLASFRCSVGISEAIYCNVT